MPIRLPETAVRHQPKSLYGFNRFACTTPAETPVRFRPFYTEYRLGYFIVGKNGRAAGRWVWGQYSPMIRAQDLMPLLVTALGEGTLLLGARDVRRLARLAARAGADT
jgi:hypothetical protein